MKPTKKQMEELERRAHENYARRALREPCTLDLEGREMVLRRYGGAFELRTSRKLLKEPDAMERIGVSRAR